jgi:hypothetical protein
MTVGAFNSAALLINERAKEEDDAAHTTHSALDARISPNT